MLPGVYNLELYRGDSYQWRFTLWDDAEMTEETDLTDATAACEIRDRSGGADITILDCTITLPNIIDVVFESPLWADEVPTKGFWDLQLTWTPNIVRTVVRGTVTVTGDITDSTVELLAASRRGSP